MRVADDQAMRWAQEVFEDEAGDVWAEPPRYSELIKIVDQVVADVTALRRAMDTPTHRASARLIQRAEELLGGGVWRCDDGRLASPACFYFYGKGFAKRKAVRR